VSKRHYTGRLSKFGPPKLAQFRYIQCLHWRFEKAGKQCGKQRWRCTVCRMRQTEGTQTKLDKIRILAPLYKMRLNIKRAMQYTGFMFETVQRYYRKFEQWDCHRKHHFECRFCGHVLTTERELPNDRCSNRECRRSNWWILEGT